LFGCGSAFLGLTLGRVDFGPRAFRAGGYLGECSADSVRVLEPHRIGDRDSRADGRRWWILATQFSIGRLFSAIFAA
jgi:hypothetical protein